MVDYEVCMAGNWKPRIVLLINMSRVWHDLVELFDFAEEHQIVVDGARPVRQEPYRLPH